MAEFLLTKALAAISERQTEADTQRQDELNIAGRGRIDPASPGARIARAKQFEADIIEQLRFLQGEPQTDVVKMRTQTAMDRLGELAAEQGDYKRAATISSSPERRSHYKDIYNAIKRSNDKECDCPDELIVDRANGKEFRQPSMVLADSIIGPDGNLLNLDRCSKCLFLNAR